MNDPARISSAGTASAGTKRVTVIGAGLAGSECAFQLAERGVDVELWEMRPEQPTPAHKTGGFAELVCSNSLRSDDPEHAAGLLKREMEAFGSLIIATARRHRVPAGSALAVNRDDFSASITTVLEQHPRIHLRRSELAGLPPGDVVIATGPLTSESLAAEIARRLGSDHLFFYDAIAPIVTAESLDENKLFRASRYGKGEGDDYLNSPLSAEQYDVFYKALVEAQVVPLRDFEKNLFFEGCLPIEELARRGVDTLRFGPMKPVGLRPPDGTRPHAVVQMRQENLARSHYNLVGFQSRMTWGEQRRVLRLIPGLENVEFERLGQVHRNTFINSPRHLDLQYRLRDEHRIRWAGQITGVEGYLESAATGLLAALYLWLERRGGSIAPLPFTTALGALGRHLTESSPDRFQPANINYGLFDPIEGRMRGRERRVLFAARAHRDLATWMHRHEVQPIQAPADEGLAPATACNADASSPLAATRAAPRETGSLTATGAGGDP